MPEESHGQANHHHHHRPGGWSREQLANLERPEREVIMPKSPVMVALDIHSGHRVADVGAGLGYFTFPMATTVGDIGTVLAIDPSRDACEVITTRAQAEGRLNIEAIERPAENTTVPSESIDRILWHTMYHDVQDLDASIDEMLRILKPQGRWVIVDWLKQDTGMGPPLDIRVSSDDAIATLRAKGLTHLESFTPGPVTWGLIVEKP